MFSDIGCVLSISRAFISGQCFWVLTPTIFGEGPISLACVIILSEKSETFGTGCACDHWQCNLGPLQLLCMSELKINTTLNISTIPGRVSRKLDSSSIILQAASSNLVIPSGEKMKLEKWCLVWEASGLLIKSFPYTYQISSSPTKPGASRKVNQVKLFP